MVVYSTRYPSEPFFWFVVTRTHTHTQTDNMLKIIQFLISRLVTRGHCIDTLIYADPVSLTFDLENEWKCSGCIVTNHRFGWNVFSPFVCKLQRVDIYMTWCVPVASLNCWRPFIWLCWAKALEQSPWWHYIGFIAVSFQKETENSFISAILSGHYFVVCYGFLSPSWSLKLFVT